MKILPLGIGLLATAFLFGGCETQTTSTVQAPAAAAEPASLTIGESDVLKIAFPGAPSLDSTQTVRRDGRITLTGQGEVLVAGKTPAQVEQDLLRIYEPQLVTKQVSVTVVSSSYPVFVSGAVLKPGKVVADRPMTVLEAVMEAGGFDRAKANPRKVVVLRNENGHTSRRVFDLQAILDGQQTTQFYLKPNDIVEVPEKFNFF